jgi:uncharacterized repeat protein (TIGR01451 family)
MRRRSTKRLAAQLGLTLVAALSAALARAQAPAPASSPPGANAGAPGTAVVGAEPCGPTLPPEVQVVRFQGPAGVRVEVLGPASEPVPVGDGHGLLTVGLKVGVGYRLRLSNLSDRPGAELFPVIEVVGHLHRPDGIDPGKYPIRVTFTEDDLHDVADRARLVTQVVYLEDPDQALPLHFPKDEIPVVTLSPAEDPLKVAAALGRVIAIVRLGARKPTDAELLAPGGSGLAGTTPCPFTGPAGARCALPCGPVCGTAPPTGRSWIPRDEFLCDGGDHAEPAHFGGEGGLRGIDPRDAVLRFSDDRHDRILPTNLVCIYAPRFAEVRSSVGPNEALMVEAPLNARITARESMAEGEIRLRRLVQNQGAEAALHRARASAIAGRVFAGEHEELRVLSGYDATLNVVRFTLLQGPEQARNREKPGALRDTSHFLAIKTAESAVVKGIIQGAGEAVMTWTPRETVGVEVPPNKPGMAVIKRVSATEAEPGDTITFAIQFRNMGNTPIAAVSIVDSLLPRLAYVPGSAKGPKGTVFTAEENRAGSTELRWDLPGAIVPGAEGYVSFEAMVR